MSLPALAAGVNFAGAYQTKPVRNIHQGEYGGKERVCIDTYTYGAEAADGDVILMGKLPAGAKPLGCRVFGPDLGGTGTLKVGVGANTESGDLADDDALITAADSSGQAYDVADGASAAMRGASIGSVRNVGEVDIILKHTGATGSATGKKVTVVTKYIIE